MLRPLLLCLVSVLLASGQALAAPRPQREARLEDLTPAMKAKVAASCFEVVVPRPDEKGMAYEKELPWDLVPFNIRNDKYFSIGTAFAVSKTELVTAFHVLDLDKVSRTFPALFIRDAKGGVFELDQITGCDQHRDVVRFAVKGRTFDAWLDLNPAFEVNQPVYTAGNALGEGTVLRRGDLIGTIPEAVDGKWNLLKSSAAVNGGNSGGPLLDMQGRVLGVVVQRNDNISLSVPVAELAALSPESAAYFQKVTYAFAPIPEKSSSKTHQFKVPLPASYRDLKAKAAEVLERTYDEEMGAFLKEQEPGLFPNGDGSHEAILHIPNSADPQLYQKAAETKVWSLSRTESKSSDIGLNGRLRVAVTANLALGRLVLPDGVSQIDLFQKPKVFMDLVHKGLNITRTVGGQQIRITSRGEPFRQEKLKDRWGRLWFENCWLNPVDDQIIMSYTTAIPGGAAFLVQDVPSPQMHEWEFDLKRILDFVHVPYGGRFKDWEQLMAHPGLLPDGFQGLKLEVEAGKRLRLQSPWISLDLEQKSWPIEAKGWLTIGMGFTAAGGRISWTLRRLGLDQDEKDDYFTVLNHLKPFPAMDDVWTKDWHTVARRLHPYEEELFSEDGASRIAMLLPSFKGDSDKADSLFTLYLSLTGAVKPSQAKKDLGTIASSIRLPAGKDQPAGGPAPKAAR